MSSKTVSSSSDQDASLEGPDDKSMPCDLIDSTYSVLGSFIADKHNGMEEAHTDNDQPEEDDGVDVIDEESVSENQEVLEGVQDLIGSDTGIYPKIHHSTEEQSSTTQIAESCDLGKSSSSSDTTAKKAGLPKIFAQVPLDMKMNLVFFIISTLLLAGYMQCRIDYVLQEYNEYKSVSQNSIKAMKDDHNKYKSETQDIIKTIQDDHNKYKSESQDIIKTIQADHNKYKSDTQDIIKTIQDDHNKYKSETQDIIKTLQADHNKYKSDTQGIIKTIQDDHNKYKSDIKDIIKTIQADHNKYKSDTQGIIKTMQDDLKQEHDKNELLSQKMESMNTQLQQFQHGGSAAMSAYIKNQIKLKTNLCPVFVEILQIAEFLVQTGGPIDVIETCGRVIWKCLMYEEVQIKLFLELNGLHLLEIISAQKLEMAHWKFALSELFNRWNEVHCTQEYVSHLLRLLDTSDIHRAEMARDASGILCKCLDDDDLWDSNTEPTKHQVSEAVSKAVETLGRKYIFDLSYVDMESMAKWVKKSSATAQQHFAVWTLSVNERLSNGGIINLIGEVILEEILKDSRPHHHTKDLIRKSLDK